MDILSAYYFFQHTTGGATRRELIECAGHYPPLHRAGKNGDRRVYVLSGSKYNASRVQRHDGLTLADASYNHLSKIIQPDPYRPLIGYGDVHKKMDALLFQFTDEQYRALEVFVSPGRKHMAHRLYQMLRDGDLDEAMQSLRQQARPPQDLSQAA